MGSSDNQTKSLMDEKRNEQSPFLASPKINLVIENLLPEEQQYEEVKNNQQKPEYKGTGKIEVEEESIPDRFNLKKGSSVSFKEP